MVKEKSFREDLYYRINVVQIQLPPLRERSADVLPLAEHFLVRSAKERVLIFSAATRKAMQAYGWPGNVRELENAVTRAVVCASSEAIEPGDLPPEVAGQIVPSALTRGGDWWEQIRGEAGVAGDLLAAGEKMLVERALGEADGNVKRAAEILGVTRAALRTRVTRYGLSAKD